jgi:hypothetical protein
VITKVCQVLFLSILVTLPVSLYANSSSFVDAVIFGDSSSENSHEFNSDRSEIIIGGLGEPARRLLPPLTGAEDNWDGGHLDFNLQIDPQKTNYVTARFWGEDTGNDHLILFCEGKQIGYRHLGDIDVLDFGDDSGEPALPGRFFYATTPLPFEMTHGKTRLNFEIRSLGPTWGYGATFAQYQKPMTTPTRGIYKVYTHTDGFFTPPADDKQGLTPKDPPTRSMPGPEVLDQVKERVNKEILRELHSARPLNEMEMQFLAKAYYVKWTAAYQNSNVISQVVKGMDALSAAWRANPELADNDPSTPNPGWFEFGPAGDAVFLLGGELSPFLDKQIDTGSGKISRRAAWSQMLQAGRDWHRHHRRLYTNQTMITDMNIYLCNRGLEVVDPAKALSEPDARRYLYEAVGLEPWRDSDPGPDSHRWDVGTNYWQLTDKGLTRELGFVGYYGEVLDWATSIYNATRPAPGQPGDGKIKKRLEELIHARAVFRYPALDADGYRAMRIETIVGWRDEHYPGNVVYAERPTWDASTLYAVAATRDPQSIGYARQMLDDNQFFASVAEQMKQSGNLRVTEGLLDIPDQYEALKDVVSPTRLPMTPGQPDFVFTDEQDGVIAVKNGDEILYASLYWRSHNAINFLARVHDITPQFDRIAVVCEDIEFDPSGLYYSRPDHINFGFANGGPRYPQDLHLAEAGEKLPIAKIPEGVNFHTGEESVYAGKGKFYTLRYGNYLIGMNMTTDETFQLDVPPEFINARDLVSSDIIRSNQPLKIAPRSTVVLWLGK